ncbi:hypothetical protein FOC84_09080 [Achromobacter pestifer]|uniref:Uncharacterized protein n=1 Tax=Achromobacter pestifer TaxID=1353889 RepID=A0A7D4DWE3_9BURK|nr:hypothetical protein [Achromobacter pestifer]QKH35085.1 hypothetical protein FOC84_09080 [Achromobacter pestifer]
MSAEVKHFVVAANGVSDFTHFAANVVERGALGLVVAEDFPGALGDEIEMRGLRAFSRVDLLRIVSLWDPLKQRAALNAFQWVVVHKEQNSG